MARPKRFCEVGGCGKASHGHGMCSTHYMRWLRTGSTNDPTPQVVLCSIPGCSGVHYGRTWCQNHYLRWYDHGDPLARQRGEVVDGKKICTACREDKPLSEYGADARVGLAIYCRECNRQKAAERRAKSPASVKEATAKCYLRRRAEKSGVHAVAVSRTAVLERDEWTCQICFDPIDPGLTAPDQMRASIDHRIPLSRGGTHTLDNVQAAHLLCNVRKGARMAEGVI